jgi:hypothetical protein
VKPGHNDPSGASPPDKDPEQGGPAASPGDEVPAAPGAEPVDAAPAAATTTTTTPAPVEDEDDDSTVIWLIVGFTALAAALGGGLAWYNRRLP